MSHRGRVPLKVSDVYRSDSDDSDHDSEGYDDG